MRAEISLQERELSELKVAGKCCWKATQNLGRSGWR